jgi:hypothetical protein
VGKFSLFYSWLLLLLLLLSLLLFINLHLITSFLVIYKCRTRWASATNKICDVRMFDSHFLNINILVTLLNSTL